MLGLYGFKTVEDAKRMFSDIKKCSRSFMDMQEIMDKVSEYDPYIGTEPRYLVLKRQGYKVLVLEKDLVFYKIDEENKKVIIYAVVDQRQDYLNIVRGL